jgi:hypothetical protein
MDEVKVKQLIREFFGIFPDYPLCRTLAENVLAGIVTYEHAMKVIQEKASGSSLFKQAIDEKLDNKKVGVAGQWRRLKDLSLEEILQLDDKSFIEAANFYFKYPFAHGRVPPPSPLKPRFWRIRFLRQIIEHAKHRKLLMDYDEWEDFLSLV